MNTIRQKPLSIIVTIHDQDLLLEYESCGKFKNQGNDIQYLFVGPRDASLVAHLDNVTVARDLKVHMEDMNFLVDFTAWFACIKNEVNVSDYVCLVQYDVILSSDFRTKTLDVLHSSPEAVVGFEPVLMSDKNFIKKNMGFAPLRDACKFVYGIDVGKVFSFNAKHSADKYWPATNNVAMSKKTLEDFVRWFEPIARHMGNQPASGHAFERAIKLYCILSGRRNIYLPDQLQHYQLNSHQTQAFTKDIAGSVGRLAKNLRP